LKNILRRKAILIALAAVVVAIISAISLYVGAGNTDAASATVNTVFKPVRSLVSAMVVELEQIYGYIYEYDSIVAENAQLKSRVATLEQEYREHTEVSQENARLRKLLELNERHSDFKYETATIISWSASSWSSSFTIDKGTGAGVSLHDCIITENGYLVGQVTSVGPNSATVTTILDTSSDIGALIYETQDAGVASGDFSLLKESKLKLGYLAENLNLIVGNTVVTSGKGGVYPQGLVIGTISDVVMSTSRLDDYAVIEPSVNFDDLVHVYVVTEYDVTD